MSKDEYKKLIEEGLDGLTLYQEVYDKETYDIVHVSGPKKDYVNRLNFLSFKIKQKEVLLVIYNTNL